MHTSCSIPPKSTENIRIKEAEKRTHTLKLRTSWQETHKEHDPVVMKLVIERDPLSVPTDTTNNKLSKYESRGKGKVVPVLN
jgi:hypothetical protein